jgi:hypothetical protein
VSGTPHGGLGRVDRSRAFMGGFKIITLLVQEVLP